MTRRQESVNPRQG